MNLAKLAVLAAGHCAPAPFLHRSLADGCEGGEMGLCEVRDQILIDHRILRHRLDEIEELVRVVESGAADRCRFLCARGLALLEALEARKVWEDLHLLPAIRDFYGPERAARAHEDQCTQRDLLRFHLEALTDRDRPTPLIAGALRDFVALLRGEMEDEERLFCDPALCEDDLFAELVAR
jgi:hypothetical protein